MSRPSLLLASLALTACASSPPPTRALSAHRPVHEELPNTESTDALYRGLQDSLPDGAWTPPLAGGTLLVTRDGTRAVAADRDRARVWVVELDAESPAVEGWIALEAGDVPGRVVEGPYGAVYVALQHAGQIARIDLDRREVVARLPACPDARGVAIEHDRLHVACAGGDLVTMGLDGSGPETRRVAADLRDVGVDAEGLWVSRFRSASWQRPDGPTHAIAPVTAAVPGFGTDDTGEYAARVAWRTLSDPDGVTVVHQRHFMGDLTNELVGTEHYYGSGAIKVGVSRWEDGELRWTATFDGALPVDAARIDDGRTAVVLAGNDSVSFVAADGQVARGLRTGGFDNQPVAIAYHPDAGLVVQMRDNPSLMVFRSLDGPAWYRGARVQLGDYLFYERPVGDRLFHRTSRGVACASCHPEGGDDGHVWRLEAQPRRTQPLRGGILAKDRYHWEGDLPSFGALINDTWVRRMGGTRLAVDEIEHVAGWIDRIPDPVRPRVAEPDAVTRGQAIFEDARAGCATCHAGDRLTDNRPHDVGTGGAFMTPSLVGLARRAPYLHDGCAPTLEARLTSCHTRGHGRVGHLDAAQRADLVAYMRSL